MLLDREVVNLRLARIEEHLGELEAVDRLSRLQFTANYQAYRDAKAAVSATVNALANILRHVDRALGGRADDALSAAVDAAWLDAALAERLRGWIALEPVLSRAHFDEDRDLVFDLATTGRLALVEFARAVTALMDAREPEAPEG